jgi:oxygen-independent coproporphyrinogen-3 oxidase
LGIGPSAHSYNGNNRQHNPSHNTKYVNALEKGSLIFELEKTEIGDALNEYLLTSLRTIW